MGSPASKVPCAGDVADRAVRRHETARGHVPRPAAGPELGRWQREAPSTVPGSVRLPSRATESGNRLPFRKHKQVVVPPAANSRGRHLINSISPRPARAPPCRPPPAAARRTRPRRPNTPGNSNVRQPSTGRRGRAASPRDPVPPYRSRHQPKSPQAAGGFTSSDHRCRSQGSARASTAPRGAEVRCRP